MDYCIGVDVGGTNLRAALMRTGESHLLAVAQAPTCSEQGYESVLARIANLICNVMESGNINRGQVCAVGLGLPGRLNPMKGVFEIAGVYLGIVISNVVVTINPQRVVIGGGVAYTGDLIIEPARRTLYKHVHLAPVEHSECIQKPERPPIEVLQEQLIPLARRINITLEG